MAIFNRKGNQDFKISEILIVGPVFSKGNEPTNNQPMKLPEIIKETNSFIALNKPAGLLSVPDRMQTSTSLKELLAEKFGSIFTVHRLDRETSGVIVYAKTEDEHRFLSMAFEERKVDKIYLGIVIGRLPQAKGLIDEPIMEHPAKNGTMIVHKKGKTATTGYEVLEDFGKYSLVRFELFTGRTHQIRVHMKNAGHPIACDELYGDGKPVFVSSLKRNYKIADDVEERPILARLGLHAESLSFTDADNIRYQLTAELPKDMRALLRQLNVKSKN